MATETPRSFRDPYWQQLASAAGARVGLPEGLLPAIINDGERSNADQVSEAGAKTVFQIIPSTRKLLMDKHGIDPYLNPQNAAEGAAILLKESIQRNGGSVAEAVGEYHGGTNRKNWGPRTKSYIARVVNSQSLAGQRPAPQDGNQTQAQQAVSAPRIAAIYEAYSSGQMTPEEAADFESDVKSGALMLPGGAAIKGQKAETAFDSANAEVLPISVVEAFKSGRMNEQERSLLQQDLDAGLVKLPDGAQLTAPKEVGFIEGVKESITGTARETEATRALPDWASMPELNQITSLAGLKTGLGTMFSSPQETVQVIKANYPGVQVRQDEKGNYILRSSVDGGEYAIKPGFRISDIPRAAGAIAAFSPAGRATTALGGLGASAATQGAIEATQAATGGEFNPADVAVAGAVGGAAPLLTRAVSAGAQKIAQLPPVAGAVQAVKNIGRRGAPVPIAETQPVARQVVQEVVSPPPQAAQEAIAPTLSAEQLTSQAKKAAEGGLGGGRALRTLTAEAAPDSATLQAAKRLEIEDYLQPDHVTTNQAYRELAQAVKSVPGSEARAAELAGFEQVGKKADEIIEKIGGTRDLSTLSQEVKSSMMGTVDRLEKGAGSLYGRLSQKINAATPIEANNVLKFIGQRSEDFGGKQYLSTAEKEIVSKLSSEAAPTYSRLDQIRKDLMGARANRGPFKDADSGLINKLYSELLKDQKIVAEEKGAGKLFDLARKVIATRKGIEDDVIALFGRTVNGSIASTVGGAVKSAGSGDISQLAKVISAIPKEMRQNVVASGIASAMRKNSLDGTMNFSTYAKWYEGLSRNKQAYSAVMSNIPLEARKQLHALAKVSEGISKASRERITTGRIGAVMDTLKEADTITGRLYGFGRKLGVGALAEGAATMVGIPPGIGFTAAITSALTKGKSAVLKNLDALISSPEFIKATREASSGSTDKAVRTITKTKAFRKFANSAPAEKFRQYSAEIKAANDDSLSNAERFVVQMMDAAAVSAKQKTGTDS
jgi:hypothetical protein